MGDAAAGDELPVVLIHLGGRAPRHLRTCAAQIQSVSGRAALMVGRRRGTDLRGAKLDRFRAAEGLTGMGLKGFWRYACERMFVLEEFMREAGLERCLHVESDVLVYLSPRDYTPWLAQAYGSSVAVCELTDHDDTAAVMYVGSLKALSGLTDALIELVELGPAELLRVHGGEMASEMRMLHILRTQLGLCEALPTTVGVGRSMGAPCLFDAASYGQYLDGTPSTPGEPFAGDHQIVGRELLGGDCELFWDAQRCRPFVHGRADPERLWPLANLHIHSKRLTRFASDAVKG